MAKIRNPVRFSKFFKIDEKLLAKLGVLNPTLNADTKLFIDPLLLANSIHKEINTGACSTYKKHFELVIRLLKASKKEDDVPWRNAKRLLEFPEIKGTCLGYSGSSVSGSGSGAYTTNSVIQTAREIIGLGVEDPDLFVALAIFEDGIGPDRISDMATNVILPNLLEFNKRVLKELKIPLEEYKIILKNGNQFDVQLPRNHFDKKSPIILVPADILRDLPIAKDWSEVSSAASKNSALRTQVNKQIAEIWKHKTLKDKASIRKWALSDKKSFEFFLEQIHRTPTTPYDVNNDPNGILVWHEVAETISQIEPFKLAAPVKKDIGGVADIVKKIIEQFAFLIEKRALSKLLYYNNNPRHEEVAQMLFFAVALSYCKANNLDITPEANTGTGEVDFKFSYGFDARVLVEIKLSTNPNVLKGYTKQLEAYKQSEETLEAFYVVIDVGRMGRKDKTLLAIKNKAVTANEKVSEITFIDGTLKPSASKK